MGAPKIQPAMQENVLPKDSNFNFIDTKLDNVLQKIVEEAKEISGFPIALVSLVMDQIQFFKAQVGLPPDLAISRATDRCSSLCQFVVETKKPFFVEDTRARPDLPQELVNLYNISAYHGFPVSVNGEVIGSLCLIDVKKNTISEEACQRMLVLAQQAGQHLQHLKKGHTSEMLLLEKASAPAMSEIRNILAVLKLTSEQAAYISHQINPVFFLLEQRGQNKLTPEEFDRSLEALQETIKVYKRIPNLLQTIQKSITRLTSAVFGLEGALSLKTGSAQCKVSEILVPSESLSHHLTKLMGGVSWAPTKDRFVLNVPQNFAITLLGSVLTSVAECALRANLSTPGIKGKFEKHPNHVRIHLTVSGMPAHEWTTLRSVLSILACGSEAVSLKSDSESLMLDLQSSAS